VASNLTKAGTSVLKMDEISQLLDIKYDFITKDELAYAGDETKDKDGKLIHKNGQKIKEIAGVAPRLLAIAASKDDRTTVANALHLGGKLPAEYFTVIEAESVKQKIQRMQDTYSAEVRELRDELNQLHMELSKKGVTEEYKPYAGFYDVFHADYPIHLHAVVATADQNTTVQNRIHLREEDFAKFHVGDHVLVKTDEITGPHGHVVATIRKKLNSVGITNTIELDQATGFANRAGKVHIYKSYGMNFKNTFAFGKFVDDKPGDKDIFTCLDDDNYRTRKRITADRTGYATTFRINPSKSKGSNKFFLDKIEIQVKKYGNPGDLMCYVINADDVGKWVNPKQAKDDGILIAASKPLHVDERDGEHIEEFYFGDDDDNMPLIKDIDKKDKKDRFCMIVEAMSADSKSNYYELLFLQHYDAATNTFSDLQLNNICYQYQQLDAATLKRINDRQTVITGALQTTEELNKCDMYYGITLKQCEEGQFIPYDDGIYTAQFRSQEPIAGNHVRLTMRVAREGIFNVTACSESDGNVQTGGKITFEEDATYRVDADDAKDNKINGFANDVTNRKIIVGTTIVTPASVQGENITPEKGLHVEIGDPVYPIGYTARLVASNIKWDSNANREIESDSIAIPLELTQVQPDYSSQQRAIIKEKLANPKITDLEKNRLRAKNRISDRLVFEGDLKSLVDANGELVKFNKFELQINWSRTCSSAFKSFAGRIYDLSVSVDR